MNLLMGNSDFFESTRTANFSEEVFQQPQPIPPAIRTDCRAIYEMACNPFPPVVPFDGGSLTGAPPFSFLFQIPVTLAIP